MRAAPAPALAVVLVLLLAACAPIVNRPGPPIAAPALEADAFVAADGVRLPLRRWMPAGEVLAVVLALHGFNDYSAAFEEPAAFLAGHGIAIYAYDQRGFGAAPGRGLWPGERTLVDDLRAAAALLRARYPGRPLIVLGESMGGGVALAALGGTDPPAVDGAILAAPAVWGRETMDIGKRVALWIAVHTAPWLTLSGRGLGITPSDNIEMLRRLARDPLIIKETRVDAIWGVVNLMDAALDAAPRVHAPLLVLYGARDEIIPKEPTAALLARLPKTGATTVAVYANGYHMLTRDLAAETVWKDMAAWVAARRNGPSAPLPSGADKRGFAALGPDPPRGPARERP